MPVNQGIYYFEYENGGEPSQPILVLIHGAGGNHLHWPSALRRLPGVRVLALDLPGHGKSEGLGEQSINAYVNVLVKWLRALKLPKAIFIGHSMGGAIVQQLALEYPERVRAIGLVGTGARLPVNHDLLEKISRAETFPGAVDLIIKWSYSQGADKKITDQVRKVMLETRPSVMHGDFLACDDFNVENELEKIHQPALILCGDNDKMNPPRFSEKLALGLPDASLQIVPDAGHMAPLEQPEMVARIIEGFIKNLS